MVKQTKRRNNRKSILQKRISRKRLSRKRISRKRISRKRISRKRLSRKRISKRKMMRGGGLGEAKRLAVRHRLVTKGKAAGLRTQDEFISHCLRKISDYEATMESYPELQKDSTENINKWVSVLKEFRLDEVADHEKGKTAIEYILLHEDAAAKLSAEGLNEILSKLKAYDMEYGGTIIKSLKDDKVFEMRSTTEKVKHILKQLFTEFYQLLRASLRAQLENIGNHIQDLSKYLDNREILDAMASVEQGVVSGDEECFECRSHSQQPQQQAKGRVGAFNRKIKEEEETLALIRSMGEDTSVLVQELQGLRGIVPFPEPEPEEPEPVEEGGYDALKLNRKIKEKEKTLDLIRSMGEDTSVLEREIRELQGASSGYARIPDVPFPEPEPEPEEPEPVEEGGYDAEQPRLGRSSDNNEIDKQARHLSENLDFPLDKAREALVRNEYDMNEAANYLLENSEKDDLFWAAARA